MTSRRRQRCWRARAYAGRHTKRAGCKYGCEIAMCECCKALWAQSPEPVGTTENSDGSMAEQTYDNHGQLGQARPGATTYERQARYQLTITYNGPALGIVRNNGVAATSLPTVRTSRRWLALAKHDDRNPTTWRLSGISCWFLNLHLLAGIVS